MIFLWDNCECLKRYANGEIIAEAYRVDNARRTARKEAIKFLRENRYYWDFDNLSEDEQKEWDHLLATIDRDLAKEPKEISALCIWGSD